MQAGAAYVRLRQQYEATVLPEAWAQQLLPERAAFLSHGTKWWNFLSGDYRRAKKRLQSLWRNPLPTEPSTVLHTIEAILEATRQEQVLASASGLMASLFGPAWQGVRSDWAALEKAQHYLTLTHQRISRNELPVGLLPYLAQNSNPEELAVLLTALEVALTQHRAAVQVVVDGLQLNEVRRFGPEGRLQFQSFAQQLSMVAAWAADLPALRLTTEWNNVAATVQADGLAEMLLLAERWEPAAHHLVAAVRQTWLEFLQKLAYEQHPALRQFERASHEETATRFRQADQDSLYHNRVRAMQQHFEQLPSQLASGQMLVLRNEFAKKARHLPLRKLMQQAGRAVQAIKPVFMMSPLSVASYLPPGAVEFDLVVFDEASQVKPVEALGAIARGQQLVVVGDSKQLPPTSFFDSLTGTGQDTGEDNVTADIQSILELCKARQMPERMLRWHYRSQHQSLIAASNHLFYHDKLVVFPSPERQGELGLVYHHLPATYYERGTTRTNPLEAQAVAEAVLHHARTTPHRTLGVVAFSTAQRQAIQDALEKLRRLHPETEAFFSSHSHEPFFVKNLENVQGDERDVILISIGYGRTQEGYLAMSFGPLNGEGGERRLNVLITRAKQRCEVFTNLTAADLDLTRTSAKGVAALKTFLEFAEHGRLHANQETARAMESPFEEAVHRALTACGHVVRPQIGSQGFYIDLAVVDPDQPGRYVLGIECDGAMYHSARSARDRDRLRQEVLEAVGWRLHRIWSTDWFRNPAAETERAVQAIEQARHSITREATDELETAATTPEAPVGITREDFSVGSTALAESYQVAQLPAAIRNRELHQHNLG
jgi:very-short-patch-repair endonuclease